MKSSKKWKIPTSIIRTCEDECRVSGLEYCTVTNVIVTSGYCTVNWLLPFFLIELMKFLVSWSKSRNVNHRYILGPKITYTSGGKLYYQCRYFLVILAHYSLLLWFKYRKLLRLEPWLLWRNYTVSDFGSRAKNTARLYLYVYKCWNNKSCLKKS